LDEAVCWLLVVPRVGDRQTDYREQYSQGNAWQGVSLGCRTQEWDPEGQQFCKGLSKQEALREPKMEKGGKKRPDRKLRAGQDPEPR
jgi:hypothetical protein